MKEKRSVMKAKTLYRRVAWYLRQPQGNGGSPNLSTHVVRCARLLRWYVHRKLGGEEVAVFGTYGVRLCLPATTGVASYLFVLREDYEAELSYFAGLCRPGMTVVDVGASYGLYTAVASHKVGRTGQVVAFEPMPSTADVLRRNLGLNGCTNVSVVQAAAADYDGRGELHLHATDTGSHSLGVLDEEAGRTEIDVWRIDSIVHTHAWQRLDVLKIDVEGCEELVLKGAIESLRRWRPAVILELNPARCAGLGLDPAGALRLLEGERYRLSHLCGGARRPGVPDIEWIRRGPGKINVIADPGWEEQRCASQSSTIA